MEYLKNTRLLNPSSSSNYKAKEKRGMSRTLLTMCDIILRMNEMKSENDNKIFYVPQLSTKINLCRTHFDFLSFILITHTHTHSHSFCEDFHFHCCHQRFSSCCCASSTEKWYEINRYNYITKSTRFVSVEVASTLMYVMFDSICWIYLKTLIWLINSFRNGN